MSSLSTKAAVLIMLRENQGKPVSGTLLAKETGISRVAVWKAVQALLDAGYAIETSGNGYFLDPEKEKDFLYPWEFGEKEKYFYHYNSTDSTMIRARELALSNSNNSAVIIAEKQSAGRGRSGRSWISRQGGLYFTILERTAGANSPLAIADYAIFSLILQIAAVRVISSFCGKKAFLRWPNDVYINSRKIAGIITEVSGEGGLITWITGGIGVNVNNAVPSQKAINCAEITGRNLSRREILKAILSEIANVKKQFLSSAVYSQGNRALAEEWNSLCDCIGVKTAVFEPVLQSSSGAEPKDIEKGKILARGIFAGIDPAGRCILKTDDGKNRLYFNQGSVSLAILNP